MNTFSFMVAISIAFGLGVGIKMQRSFGGSAHLSENQASVQSELGEFALSRFVRKETPLDSWLAFIDVMQSPTVPWAGLLKEVAGDRELRKLVVYHWAKRNAKACWDYLQLEDDPFHDGKLPMIVIKEADPRDAITWPDRDEESHLRWAVFTQVLRDDFELAFTLTSELGPKRDSKNAPYFDWNDIPDAGDWAAANPQRACDLLDSAPSFVLESFASAAAYALAKEDLESAISWAKAQRLSVESSAMSSIAHWLHEQGDVDGVERIARKTRSLRAREQIITPILAELDRSFPGGSEQWILDHLEGSPLLWQRLIRSRVKKER